MIKKILGIAIFLSLALTACENNSFVQTNIDLATRQIGMELDGMKAKGKWLNPVTLKADGSVHYCGYSDWRSGFFPGSLWYLYEMNGDTAFLTAAKALTAKIEKGKTLTWHHDVGFIIECSYGNALRLTGEQYYAGVIVEAAKSLSTRFREIPGVIQSWNVNGNSWQAQRGWECPVIIDNMMNLELLFHATRLSNDSTYYKIAVSHADRTLQEHFRPDGSCYHVIDYSIENGTVRHRQTAQGYADESAWARGQAWAIYGYTVCYRETKDRKYLEQAVKTFRFMKNHKNMPEDLVPYWDMDAHKIPNEPRDASSAAIIASALYELSTSPVESPGAYKEYADRIMKSLASPAYLAPVGTNGNFLLMHSVGSIPHNSEIDVPLNYADYYFLEALQRKRNIEE
ncbi:glycoside hydrolase family 88 protein [Bacteroides sp. UBA939]|uniref:glycoside hydrolase family 88 protein n=1 Tax=Bacteroides sp. UBA939 TaxID=1946092 RepID=UPI0025C30880|nr:glycoside hydrolase family 88 protein [Bacteroides sp. UBA939]